MGLALVAASNAWHLKPRAGSFWRRPYLLRAAYYRATAALLARDALDALPSSLPARRAGAPGSPRALPVRSAGACRAPPRFCTSAKYAWHAPVSAQARALACLTTGAPRRGFAVCSARCRSFNATCICFARRRAVLLFYRRATVRLAPLVCATRAPSRARASQRHNAQFRARHAAPSVHYRRGGDMLLCHAAALPSYFYPPDARHCR